MDGDADLEHVVLVGRERELALGVGEVLALVEGVAARVRDVHAGRVAQRLGELVLAGQHHIPVDLLLHALLLVGRHVEAQRVGRGGQHHE